ncbi:hypothetical protein [Actinomadura litoris]|uniref:hypothetical protein n=1 Tax=Actinomadura litoris TaxID=2678616 RepID=UPI001FA73060|nr:hypothetical protein [Actinomadura litoris]
MTGWDQATPDERRLWVKLLTEALHASKAGYDEDAVTLIRLVGITLGADAVAGSLVYLADRAASLYEPGPAGADEVYGIVVVDDAGREVDIEELPYPMRWSARMVAAAANRDADVLQALVSSALDDGRMDSCIAVLMQMAATVPAPARTVGT